MADLKSLFAKKATPNAEPAASTDGTPAPATSEQGATQAAPPTPPQPATGGPKRFGIGKGTPGSGPAKVDVASGGTNSGSSESKSGLRSLSVGAGASDSSVDSGGVAQPSLDSLDAINSLEDEGVAPRGERVSYFADETPATKPTRELPEGLSKDALGFIDTIDSVYEIIHDPDLLGGVIRNIMIELKQNPEYTKLLAPEDVRAMVRGMRESMGLARVKKQEAKAKRSGTGKGRSKKIDDDILAGIDELGIDLGNL